MIGRTLSKVSKIQILISVATSIALIVDSIIISRFLGTSAMAGYGAVAPILMIIMAVSGVISTGSQIICAERIGKADTEGANRIVGLSIVISLMFAAFFILASFLGENLIIKLIGLQPGTELAHSASDYLKGFIIGAPAFIGTLTLMPYMQLDGNRRFALMSMVGVTVGDCVCDVLAVFMFHGGILGIGVASAVSYYIGTLILLAHFLLKKGALRIRFDHLPWKETLKIFSLGISSATQKVLRTVLGLTANRVLLASGGAGALAAYAVIKNISNLANSCGQGISAAVMLLTSVLAADEDRSGLLELHKSFIKKSAIYNVILMAVTIIGAYPIALVFQKKGADISTVVMGIRLISFDYFFYSLCMCCRNYYQGMKKTWLSMIITILQGYGFIGAFTILIGSRFGLYGVCVSYPLSEIASLLVIAMIVWIVNKKIPVHIADYLLLPRGFGIPKDDIYEISITDMDGVVAASEKVFEFAKQHGIQGEKDHRAVVLSLAVEELAKNVVLYGFNGKNKYHLDVRVCVKNGKLMLRLRDDCKKFSPVDYMNQFAEHRPDKGYGIPMISNMASDMKYLNTLGLNIVHITA